MGELGFNTIVAIVVKAMKDKYIISNYKSDIEEVSVITIQDEDSNFIFRFEASDEKLLIESKKGRVTIDINEEEKLRFELLLKDCDKYTKSSLIQDINTFFEEKPEPAKDINDLDNDDE